MKAGGGGGAAAAAEGADDSFHLREDIIDLLPRTYREKARKLYNHIAPFLARAVDWKIEKGGALHYKNKPLDANIVDFLAYAVGRSKSTPNNYEKFEKLLKSIGTPAILLRRPPSNMSATDEGTAASADDDDDQYDSAEDSIELLAPPPRVRVEEKKKKYPITRKLRSGSTALRSPSSSSSTSVVIKNPPNWKPLIDKNASKK